MLLKDYKASQGNDIYWKWNRKQVGKQLAASIPRNAVYCLTFNVIHNSNDIIDILLNVINITNLVILMIYTFS